MRIQTILLAVTLVSASSSAFAGPISAVHVFGDSLSDNGNLTAIGQSAGVAVPMSPPYATGRASNGPVAVEYMAAALGAGPLLPVPLGGTNYSVIGAATGEVPFPTPADPANTADNIAETLGLPLPVPTGMLNGQLPFFLSSLTGPIDRDALFVIWGGPNDIFINPSEETARAAADNIAAMVGTLHSFGARRFLLPGMPDLGLAPGAAGNAAFLTHLTETFNERFYGNLKTLRQLDHIGIALFDTTEFYRAAFAGDLGFVNVTSPCVLGNVLAAVRNCTLDDEEGYLFWDSSHPTTAAHQMLGGQFARAANELTVPEPVSLLLAGAGLGAVAWRRRRAA
jgi:phospholipase/lecithinase/hemolysin